VLLVLEWTSSQQLTHHIMRSYLPCVTTRSTPFGPLKPLELFILGPFLLLLRKPCGLETEKQYRLVMIRILLTRWAIPVCVSVVLSCPLRF
jgi:hypothetical protein